MDTPSHQIDDFRMAVLESVLAYETELDNEEVAMSLLAPVGHTDMTPSVLAGSSAGVCWVIGSLMQIQPFEHWIRWGLVAGTAIVLGLVVVFAWQFEDAVGALVADCVREKRDALNYSTLGVYGPKVRRLFEQSAFRQSSKIADIRNSVVKHTADFKFACAVVFLAFVSCAAFVTQPYAEKASFLTREWYNYLCFGILFFGTQILIVYGNLEWKNATLRTLKDKLQ